MRDDPDDIYRHNSRHVKRVSISTKLISRIPWAIYVHYPRNRAYLCVSGRVQDDYSTHETRIRIVRCGSLLIIVIVIAIGIPSMR